ncbi:MAG: hydroxymethylbilane synthase [Parvibaculales bacterium]
MTKPIRVGTRRSPLALAQTAQFVEALCRVQAWERERIEIVGLSTKGDEILDRSLTEIGGKGLFTHELEQGLLCGDLDFAVHSLKDLPTRMPDGLTLGCVPERDDPHDVLISLLPAGQEAPTGLDGLPEGAVVGSASLRRVAQLKAARPDLKTMALRGNIATRLSKLSEGEDGPQATLLAAAGLNRIRREEPAFDASMQPENGTGLHFEALPPEVMLPAPGQGALGIQCRHGDDAMLAFLAALDCARTRAAISAERAYLAGLEGSCRTPIAALANVQDGQLELKAKLFAADGSDSHSHHASGDLSEAAALGHAAAAAAKAEKPHLLPQPADD